MGYMDNGPFVIWWKTQKYVKFWKTLNFQVNGDHFVPKQPPINSEVKCFELWLLVASTWKKKSSSRSTRPRSCGCPCRSTCRSQQPAGDIGLSDIQQTAKKTIGITWQPNFCLPNQSWHGTPFFPWALPKSCVLWFVHAMAGFGSYWLFLSRYIYFLLNTLSAAFTWWQ